MRTSNPMLKKEAFRKEGASASAMTIGGTVGKTFIMLILLLATSVYSYIQMMQGTMKMPVLIGALIVAAIIAFASMFFPRISPFGAPIYANGRGCVRKYFSSLYNEIWRFYRFKCCITNNLNSICNVSVICNTRSKSNG